MFSIGILKEKILGVILTRFWVVKFIYMYIASDFVVYLWVVGWKEMHIHF